MRIVELSIEGFKSYGDRVKLGPFGPRFTAICGPNGSGKSNCFDAICFAMGFRVGADMRADNLTDLIYQRGQSGVCSASVTLTFDNSDKSFSPALYSECPTIRVSRQIALRGRDRFFVNGELRRMTDIEKLFKEAKLNIRAPHQFVIMQGKIQEIVKDCSRGHLLHYLEDCVGTSLFEKEKEKSEKILLEKNAQLKSINNDLATLLQPALDKAKTERANYLRWLESGKEVLLLKALTLRFKQQILSRVAISYAEELKRLAQQLVDGQSTLKKLRESRAATDSKITMIRQDINEKTAVVSAAAGDGEKIQTLSSGVVALEEELKLQEQALKEKKAEQSKLTKLNRQNRSNLATFETSNNAFVQREQQLQQELTAAGAELAQAIDRLDAAKNGVWLDPGGRGNLQELVAGLKADERDLRRELQGFQLELDHHRKEAERLAGGNAARSAELDELLRKIEHWKEVKRNAEEKLRVMSLNRDEEDTLQTALNAARQEEEKLADQLRAVGQRFVREEKIRAKFKDEQQVPGVLMDVFRVKDARFALALEEAAKGRLFHVVVDNDDTATQLFQWASNHGVRVTCLPVNRLNNQPPNAELVKRAKTAGSGAEVYYSLEIIEHQPQFTACLVSALNVFVTNSKEAAKRINKLDKWVHNTLTEEGDSYNPTGQISGGSKAGMNKLLRDRAEHLKLQKRCAEVAATREELCQKLNYFLSRSQDHKELCSLIEQAEQKGQTLTLQLDVLKSGTDEGRALHAREEVIRLTTLVEEKQQRLDAVMAELKPLAEALTACVNSSEAALKKLGKAQAAAVDRQQRAEAANRALAAEQEATIKQHAELKTQVATLEEAIASLEKQCAESLEPQVAATREQLAARQADYKTLAAGYAEKERVRDEALQALRVAQQEVEDLEDQMRIEAEGLSQGERLRERAAGECEKVSGQVSEVEREYAEALKACSNDETGLATLEATYLDTSMHEEVEVTILNEVLERMSQDLALRSKERAALQMRLDKKCIDSLGQIEAEFNSLKLSKQKVEKEHQAVVDLIANIEQQKLKKLQTSFQRVNQYFSNIFSTLLPGANTFMVNNSPDFAKGLELAVEFNGVRKKGGLQDLSGGQKSLLALSLLLALLKLNPCPFYVFDEVDAALDSGHTQNLGVVIRDYFGESQFLIVSHRENFYSNAEVIFQTSCVNGKSHISTRTV